jgi:hypothetical protein
MVTTGNKDGNNLYLDGVLSSIGPNSINEYSNSISITNTTSYRGDSNQISKNILERTKNIQNDTMKIKFY